MSSKERQQTYMQRLKETSDMVKFPLEKVVYQSVLLLFPESTKTKSLQSAITYAIECRQNNVLPTNKKRDNTKRDLLEQENATLKAAFNILHREQDELKQQLAELTQAYKKKEKEEAALKQQLAELTQAAQAAAVETERPNLILQIKELVNNAEQEITAATQNPKTKQTDPSKIPTWKNLHKFLLRLNELFNEKLHTADGSTKPNQDIVANP
jgi:hypothetical protein